MAVEEKVANTAENRETLAREIVESWDFKDLVQYAVDHIEENFGNCDAAEFDEYWRNFYGD